MERDEPHADWMPIAICTVVLHRDGAPSVADVSGSWLRSQGLPVERMRADPMLLLDSVRPEDRDRLLDSCRRACRDARPFRWRGRLCCAGSTRWVALDVEHCEDGGVWRGVMFDVSAARALHGRWRGARTRFERLTDAYPHPLFVVSSAPPHPVVYANLAARALLRHALGDASGTVLWEDIAARMSPESLARIAPGARPADASTTRVGVETEVIGSSGARQSLLIVAAPLDEDMLYVVADITRERRAEAALSEARRDLEAAAYDLTENIPIGTYTMVLRPGEALARFAFMSRRFLEITGLTREEAREDPLKAFACVHPEERDAWVEKNARAFAARTPFREEARLLIEGRVSWIVAESVPRPLTDGAWIWEGVISDITAQKEAEQRLEEAARREARLEERRRLLEDLHDGFGGQIAVARLRMSMGELSTHEAGEILQDCLDDLRLVFDTLDAGENGLTKALADIRFRMDQRVRRLPVALAWDLPVDDPVALEPRAILQITRILQEALSNALRHAAATTVRIRVWRDGDGVALRIADDGVGIDPGASSKGRGLRQMRSRAAQMGWILTIRSGSAGTVLQLRAR